MFRCFARPFAVLCAASTEGVFPLAIRAALVLVFLLLAFPRAQGAEAPAGAAQLVHLLDYMAVDYPGAVAGGRVVDAGEYAEMAEFATRVVGLVESLPGAGETGRRQMATDARELAARVGAYADGAEIAERTGALKRQVIAAWQVRVAPRRSPDLARGAALYAEHCVACHGALGRGDGPAARGLDPAPSDFHDAARMAQRSLHGLYNTITLGVAGTAMTAWPQLSEADRWALAFHVGGLAVRPQQLADGEARWRAAGTGGPLADLAALTGATAQALGAEAPQLAFLTRRPEVLATAGGDPLSAARRMLADSAALAAAGEPDAAQRQAVAAYLEGFELAEAALDRVDPALRLAIETEMMAYRRLVAGGDRAAIAAAAQSLDARLAAAAERLAETRLGPVAAGLSAFGILFREGLEAILVLAALGAGIVRTAAPSATRRALRHLHAGWIAALVAGAATWLVAEKLVAISGATRETTEGVTALASAAILLYVGFWLHGKAHAEDWARFLGDRVGGALSRGTLGLLAAVSFLAVYREAFETVLFFQALAAQAAEASGALAAGAGGASLALLGVAWAVFRGGLRLPVALFFRLSAALLAGLAVVFAGQGIAALQEAGQVAADPVAFLRLPWLGIYPTVQTLGAQFAALALVATTVLMRRRATR